MKRIRLFAILPLLLLAFVGVFYTNCESFQPPKRQLEGGTGVGNPMAPASSKLLASACDVIHRCHPDVSLENCQTSILATQGFDYQVGLPTGYFSSFKDVMQAEEKGQLSGNSDSLESCSQLVTSLSCDSPQVAGAVEAITNSFWGSPRIFMHELCSSALRTDHPQLTGKLHYIRAGATGQGDGSDWSNACPGFTGPCAGNALHRGDTYFVAAGDYGSVEFNVPGTDLITIKKATVTDHGSDTGWLASYASGPAAFANWVFTSSHWVMDGQERASLTSGHGFRLDLPRLASNCLTNFCNAILLDSDSTIDRMTFRYVEIVGFGVDSNRHLNGLYSVPMQGTSSNIVLYGVAMHDFPEFNGNSPIKTSNGVFNLTIDNSSFVRSAARVFSDQGSNNVTIRNSWFENVGDQGIIVSYSIGNVGVDTKNWSIHGNVFWESDPSRYGVDATIRCTGYNNCINWQIANNTFANFTSPSSISAGIDFYYSGASTVGNRVVNNIWYNCARVGTAGSSRVTPAEASIMSDYNMYIASTIDAPPVEPHGFIGSVSPFIDVATGDFRLSAPTNAGLTLPAPLNWSRDGKLRGLDGIWDRGAFEY
jgi:hypothetical protein